LVFSRGLFRFRVFFFFFLTDPKSEFIFQNSIFYIYSKEWLHMVAFQI